MVVPPDGELQGPPWNSHFDGYFLCIDGRKAAHLPPTKVWYLHIYQYHWYFLFNLIQRQILSICFPWTFRKNLFSLIHLHVSWILFIEFGLAETNSAGFGGFGEGSPGETRFLRDWWSWVTVTQKIHHTGCIRDELKMQVIINNPFVESL